MQKYLLLLILILPTWLFAQQAKANDSAYGTYAFY